MPLSILLAASETAAQRDSRRRRSGAASHETFADTLRRLDPECRIDWTSCVDEGGDEIGALADYDGIVFPGSPIQMYEDTAETRSAARFMERVFESGVLSFGSCAGLQIAAVAAGGTTKPRDGVMEAGIARGIVATEAGRGHPMLRGREMSWDALAMHSTIVDRVPDGMSVLASARGTPVEAAEVRHGNGTFWGVQYHPEVSMSEIADALDAQKAELVEQGLAEDEGAVKRYVSVLNVLDREPDRRDLQWQIGVDGDVTDADRRQVEIRNFLRVLHGRG